MIKNIRNFILIIYIAVFFPASLPAQVNSQGNLVNAVLFYSPDCPHCHQVIEEVLIPLSFRFPDSLQIFGIDTTTQKGGQVFQNYIENYKISAYRQGVPALVIGDTALAGEEIEQQAAAVIDKAMSSQVTPLPSIPGLLNSEDASGDTIDLKPLEMVRDEYVQPPPDESTATAEIDPVDKIIGWSVFIVLAAAAVYFFFRLSRFGINPFHGGLKPKIPIILFFLGAAGLFISLYLSYVEIHQIDALCGPVGDCNVVQDSVYSRILGIPVAVLGTVHYFIIIFAMVIYRNATGIPARISSMALILLAFMAVLYSIFLTVLEIGIIQAVCAWCLGSAVISAVLLMVLSRVFIRKPLA